MEAFVINTSIELLKNKRVINRVVRHQKAGKSVRALKILQLLSVQSTIQELVEGDTLHQRAKATAEQTKRVRDHRSGSVVDGFMSGGLLKKNLVNPRARSNTRFSRDSGTGSVNGDPEDVESGSGIGSHESSPTNSRSTTPLPQRPGEVHQSPVVRRKLDVPADKIMEYSDLFTVFDIDNSGSIAVEELSSILDVMGSEIEKEYCTIHHDCCATSKRLSNSPIFFSPQGKSQIQLFQINKLVETFDDDASGEIEFDEFCQLMWVLHSKMEMTHSEEQIRDMFGMFDKDGNGIISVDEFRAALTHLGTQLEVDELDELIKEVDENGDGEVDVEEFAELIHKYTEF
eukprot:TRINITY_DN1617_c0_g1_i1.p1 TRINITY_DN1617_c0_g1~~TRINITY_DN1617_c0_g1_i1.p1  ORF type:complete len:344 (-),score=109.48 TRINITY_DN1617_c0_g1_i1:254-1285(-)